MQTPGAFTFRHIVIREVAYATLPRAERVRAHLRFARWLIAALLAAALAWRAVLWWRTGTTAGHRRRDVLVGPLGRTVLWIGLGTIWSSPRRLVLMARICS